MKFSHWIVERNQRDATKMPRIMTNQELNHRAAQKRMHAMKHGRAGAIETDRNKGARGGRNREAIEKSGRGE